MRAERRSAPLTQATLHDAKPGPVIDSCAVGRGSGGTQGNVGTLLVDVKVERPLDSGIEVLNVFGPWPMMLVEMCVACGYFGTSTVDMMFASGSRAGAIILAIRLRRVSQSGDIEKRFVGVRRTCRKRLSPHLQGHLRKGWQYSHPHQQVRSLFRHCSVIKRRSGWLDSDITRRWQAHLCVFVFC